MSLRMTLRAQRGFTLVELAVVLAVLGVAVVSGWPFLRGWRESIDLKNAASGVSDFMLSARMRSVVDRGNYTVSADYASDALSATPLLGTALNIGSGDLYLDSSDPDCPPLSSGDVVFRPNGTADAAGFEAVYIKSRSPRVRVRYRVKVLGATGKVSVEKWAGGEWYGAY